MADSLMNQLNALVNQIDNSSCCPRPMCCGPCPPCCGGDSYITTCVDKPYVQCTMLTPPPCAIPLKPCPVQPLQMPCPTPQETENNEQTKISPEDSGNFYNNYNMSYRPGRQQNSEPPVHNCSPEKKQGVTIDGRSPCSGAERKKKEVKKAIPTPGCPTGFKPCTMKLVAPPNCDPAGIWMAQVQPCPPKPAKKVSNVYKPGPCKKPGCKHWKPKDPPCLYDQPCKAHCYNHPPGMKPKDKN